LLTALDKRVHRTKRRIIGQGLSQASMQKFEPIMMSHINLFVKLLAESKDLVNVTNACKYLGTDIIGTLGFGATLNTQTTTDKRWMVEGMIGVSHRMNYRLQFPELYYMYHHWFPHVMWSRMSYIVALLKMIKDRLAEGIHAKTDLLSFVYDEVDPETGKKMEVNDLWNEAVVLFPAGKSNIVWIII
jgi:cytochrome P450